MKNIQKYFAYLYNKQTDNHLFNNSYHGNVTQVRKNIDDGINVYSRTPDMHETPLHLAIVGAHTEIVNLLLNVYEQDLNFIENTLGFRPKTPILIGFGADDIQIVQNLFKEYEHCEVSNESVYSSKCVVILLKRDNYRPIQVLCLSPRLERGKLLVVQMIRRVIKNSVLDMNGSTRNDDSLIKIAAAGGSFDLFHRLVKMGAGVNYIEEIVMYAIQFGQIKFLEDLKSKYEYKMNEMFELEKFKSVIFRNNKWSIFKYVTDQIVAEQKLTWPQIVNIIFPHAVLFNHVEIIENCLGYTPDLITKDLHGNIPLHNLFLCDKSKNLVMKMIASDPAQLKVRDIIGYSVVHKLANANRIVELKSIYEKYPSSKSIFFEEHHVGLMAVEYLVARKYYEITKLIIQNSTLDTELLYHILNKIATGDNLELFEYVLAMETYDFTMPPSEGEYHVLITTLQYQNPAMFHAILSHIKFDLNQITTVSNLNLLRFAIWAKRPVFDVISCFKESSDSENEEMPSRRKLALSLNKQDPFKITDRDLILRSEFNEIFDQLIEKGVDYQKTCADSKPLIHYSVEAKNVYTTRRLLELGAKLNVYDETGNLPIHYTRNVEMFKLLSTWTTLSYTNARNTIDGKSLLHYLTEQAAEHETLKLIQHILENGGDTNAIDHLNRSPIYYANDLEIVQLLLNYRPNLNIQDLNMDTPIHSAFTRSCFHIANLLLEQNSTDYTMLNKDGVSYLACFTNERNTGQDFIIQFLDVATLENPKFRSLLETHCNGSNKFGTPIFLEAIGISDLLTSMLLEVANDLNIFDRDPITKDSALHVAARFGKCDLADKLIAKGLSIEDLNANGDTCLIVCCERSIDKLERFLLHRPRVNVKNENGMSPILQASYMDITGDAICDLLINGGDIMDSDSNGQTAYENLSNELKQIFNFLIN